MKKDVKRREGHLMAVKGYDAQRIARRVGQARIPQVNLDPDGGLVALAGDVAQPLAGNNGAKVGPALPPALLLGRRLLWLCGSCQHPGHV